MTVKILIELAARFWHWIIIALLVTTIVALSMFYRERGYAIDAIKAEHERVLATERAVNLAELNNKIQINNERWQSAVNQNTQAQKQIADSYASNNAIVNSLSDTIDKASSDYIKADANARAEYTAAISDISKDCIGEITALSKVADGHVADIIMLQKAWPKR